MMHLLIDANNIAHRARHVYELSYQGKDTSVLYGVCRMIISLLEKHKPTSAIMCWDGGAPDYRSKLVPSYKAGRHKDDPTYVGFIAQLIELQRVLAMTGMLQVRRRGIEADDLMYHASRMIDDDCLIVTNDADLLQAVNDNVHVLSGDKEIDPYRFEEKYGFTVDKFVMAKVLQGDGSDNIPGVHGIGPMTAAKLVAGKTVYDNATPAILKKLKKFISSGAYNRAYTVVDLSLDLCGARMALLDAEWYRYTRKFDQWCISNGFVSLLEGRGLSATFGKLKKPAIKYDDTAVPRIWQHRRYPDVRKEVSQQGQ